jgi:hypothetical protein
MRSSYLSLHLSDHKTALRDLVSYALGKREEEVEHFHYESKRRKGREKRRRGRGKKSSGYLCYSLMDLEGVYGDDSDLCLVKGCVDILLRAYDSLLAEVRRSSKKRKKEDSSSRLSTEERELLQKRDQEVRIVTSHPPSHLCLIPRSASCCRAL